MAIRVPMQNSSLVDCVFEIEQAASRNSVNQAFRKAAEGDLSAIFGYEERPLVSVDYLHDPRSSIIDALSTSVVNGTQLKVLAWYDNEWGYIARMIELTEKVVKSIA